MIFWYWYLAAAAALTFAGYITPDPVPLAALAALVHLHSRYLAPRGRTAAALGAAAAAGGALVLLWRGSFLPPPSTVIKFLADPKTRPSARYMLEFAWQSADLYMLACGALLFALVFFGYRRKPLPLALSVYLVLASACALHPQRKSVVLDPGGTQEAGEYPTDAAGNPLPKRTASVPGPVPLDPFYAKASSWEEGSPGVPAPAARPARDPADRGSASPKAFYKKESGRMVEFSKPANGSPPFDIIILHICSLSWKDIRDSGADLLPFFSRFDYVFTNFSSACSYSGPSALRVLKSPCGQVPHPALYNDAPAGCYLMDKLRESGFKTFTMASHDGAYGDFSVNSRKYGHADPPLGIEGLPAVYRMFSGTRMCQDDAALDRYWKVRTGSKAERAAVYYNTANLHMGTSKPGASLGADAVAAYRERLELTVKQLESFFSEVERSGRNAVVFLAPEHGAALTGTKMQARDVRDIPLPPIVTVPAAVKLIGKNPYSGAAGPQVITKPASFFALAWLISEFLRDNPFSAEARRPETVAAEAPATGFLAEDENAAVMKIGDGYVYRLKEEKWFPLPAYAEIPPGTIPSPQDFRRAAGR